MIIGKVIGTVVATRKNHLLTGSKFLIVEPFEKMHGGVSRIVAIDNVGAGIGEIVLVALGSAARAGLSENGSEKTPVDALIVGIVDDPGKIVIEG